MWNSPVIGNYNCGLQVFPSDDKTKIGINFLQRLIATWDLFRDKIILRVQNEQLVNFWTDLWVPNAGTLVNHFTR
jgi:hypothetical protein